MFILALIGLYAIGVVCGSIAMYWVERTRGADQERALQETLPYAMHLAELAQSEKFKKANR